MHRRHFLALLAASTTPAFANKSSSSWSFPSMGSVFRAHFDSPPSADLKDKIIKRLTELESIFTVHRPDSEALTLCRLANAQPHTAIPVSPTLFTLMEKAKEFSELTNGAFDITIGPLTSYWRSCQVSQTAPDPKRVHKLAKRVDHRQITLKNQSVTFTPHNGQVLLDFGAIAKGYAADEILRLLKNEGISCACIDLGGEIVASEAPSGKKGWPVQRLDAHGAPIGAPIQLANAAISTSGDLYQKIQTPRNHFSHVLSQSEPAGISKNRLITVKSATALEADVFATALHAVNSEKQQTWAPEQHWINA